MKRFYTLFLLLALCGIASHAGLVTTEKTVWEEDFESMQGDINNAKLTYSYAGMPPSPMQVDDNIVLCAQVNPYSYSCLNMTYNKEDINDNWTLSFYYNFQQPRLPGQLAVTNKNATMGGVLSSNTFLSIVRDGGDESSNFLVKLGNSTLSDKLENVSIGTGYIMTLTCTDAGTDYSTLSLKIRYAEGNTIMYQGSTVMDTRDMGPAYGVYIYQNSMAPARVYFDDMKITKEEVVDDTPCSTPTYKITGANGKARKFTLDCETEGATIYYSTSFQEPGADEWIEYTGETETESDLIFTYAHSNKNGTNSDIETFRTGAGSPLKITAPQIKKIAYDESKGYAVQIVPDYTYMDFVPGDYNLKYSIDGGEKQNYTEGDTIFVTEGSKIYAYAMSAEGTTGSINIQTAVRPKAPELWSQDFQSLVNSTDNNRHAIVLDSNSAFDVDTKSLYNIKQYKNGSQSIDINVDKRLALSTDSCFFLVAKNNDNAGLLGYKHVQNTSDDSNDDDSGLIIIINEEEEEDTEATDGLGINGLSEGQYIFVTTNGGSTSPLSGANMIQEASTDCDQIYVATGSTMMLDIPFGVSIKDITVRSNFEAVTTNGQGYATYVCINPIDVVTTQANYPDDELTASVVTEEVRSGTFIKTPVDELIANTAFILKGKPNTTYQLALGTSTTPRYDENLLIYSDQDFNTNSWENPVYVVAEDGEIVKLEKGSVITAGTPFIKSRLEEAEYFELTLGAEGCTALVTPKALDFDTEEKVKAYIADYETLEKGVNLKEVASVPAGTPVVIKGTPGTYYIQVGLCTEISGNKLRGSLNNSYNTADTLNMIYTFSTETGKMDAIVDKTTTPTLNAGTVYFISKYIGMEPITTDAYGTATLTSRHNIHFEEVSLRAYIVTGETEIKPTMANVSEIPAGTAFVVKGGAPDSTYNIPIHNTATLGQSNLLISKAADYNVDDEPNYIWAWSGESGDFYRTEEGTVIPAGEAFFVSSYERKPNLGSETITTNALGFTTYVCRKPLDFTTTDVTAYVATEERPNGNIILTKVNEVPKGTAFVIKGEANTPYEIPVGTCEKLNTINIFQGDTIKEFFVGDTINIVYIISKKDGKFHPVSRNSTIPAGKAYIISRYVGVEYIQTDEYGWASHLSTKALDFSEQTGVEVYIAIDQKYGEFTQKQLTEVAPNTAFIFHGAPNTNYLIPTGSCTSNGLQNLFQIRSTQTPVSNFDTYVYGLNSSTGKLEKRDDSYVIPAGEIFIESNFRGFETITTNATGTASHVSEHPLDFSESELIAYKATHITVKGVTTLEPMTEVSAETPFVVKGEPNTTYNIPIGTTPAGANPDNIFSGSLTEDFYVGSVDTYVYALSKTTGNFTKISANSTIKAGKAYIISPYRGYVEITTNESGTTSHISTQPLDFSEFDDLIAYIVIGESDTVNANGDPSIITKPVKEVPTGTPFIIANGTPTTTYAIPIGTCEPEEWSEYGNNLLQGDNENDFIVYDAYPNKVYALSKLSGNFKRVSKTSTIGKGKAYYVSSKTYEQTNAKGIAGRIDNEEDYTAVQSAKANDETPQKHRFVNLAGQEVDDDYRGIVIDENGKKYNRK